MDAPGQTANDMPKVELKEPAKNRWTLGGITCLSADRHAPQGRVYFLGDRVTATAAMAAATAPPTKLAVFGDTLNLIATTVTKRPAEMPVANIRIRSRFCMVLCPVQYRTTHIGSITDHDRVKAEFKEQWGPCRHMLCDDGVQDEYAGYIRLLRPITLLKKTTLLTILRQKYIYTEKLHPECSFVTET